MFSKVLDENQLQVLWSTHLKMQITLKARNLFDDDLLGQLWVHVHEGEERERDRTK